MSNKDKNPDETNYARLHDGWCYVVTFAAGFKIRLYSQDNLEQIYTRYGIVKPGEAVYFDGAHVAETNEDGKIIVGSMEGKGMIIKSQDIVSVRYLAAHDDEPSDAAMDAARAFYEIQRDALLDVADEGEGEADEPESEEADEPLTAGEILTPAFKQAVEAAQGRRAARRKAQAEPTPAQGAPS